MKILEKGIYLVVLGLPLYLIRFKIFDIPTTLLELMIFGLFIGWLINGFNFKDFKNLLITHYLLLIAILLILIGVSIATVYSWDFRVSAGIWKAWFIDPLLFFIVFISVIKKPEQITRVFYCLIFSGFAVSIISLIYLIQGNLDGQGRLQGFYNSPNYLAMYLAPALIASFWILFFRFPRSAQRAELRVEPFARSRQVETTMPAFGLKTRSRTISKTILLIVNCLLLIIILFFTKSLGAWLGIIAALVFGLIIYFRNKQKKVLLWGIVFCGLIIVLVFTFLKINSIQGKLSLDSRLIIWQRAWEAFKGSPIRGIGPGTFADYFPSYPIWGVPQPHNLYFAFLLQTGIIGFIGFVWLLIHFFKTGFKLFTNHYSLLITIIMSVMVYILVHGLVDTLYWKNDLSVFFWIIIGCMVVLKFNNSKLIRN